MAEQKKQAKKSFWAGLKSEFGKIMWTDQKTLGRQTVAVVVISVIICLLITLIDSASLSLIELLIK
ncbi:MAG: preprotein translocase subunit SecE [Eubacterium sp.]|nr:preprotein translocase subunit SecE [Eubacterium sp.]